ncbi:HET-domain-containing protein, partial [Patellaria atrata CBS 101060]
MCASGDLSHEFECFGHISWNSCSTSAPPTGRGRFIDPLLADFELVRNWLTFCCKNHTRDCTVESGDPIRMFQLIDCNSNKIVTAIRRMKYIALSYVWGVHSSEDALEDGKLVWKHLPQTIRDAIKITKLLGYRYLWVDRYCIPADPRLKHTQIRKMDIIYQHAQATLLGAAGKNATYGLPGAGTRCRKTQRAVEMGQHKLFSTFARPETVIKQSTWMTRGWTYQEAMLSKRRIFFTDEQVYFECAGMQCSE